jgi:hypothetical protein
VKNSFVAASPAKVHARLLNHILICREIISGAGSAEARAVAEKSWNAPAGCPNNVGKVEAEWIALAEKTLKS